MKIIAHGDSWFDYPEVLLTGGSIIDHLSRIYGLNIINLAHHGDGTEDMLSITKRESLVESLPGADILLFSGGGNDIAGDQFCIWLNEHDSVGGDINKAIVWDRFDKAIAFIISNFDDLADIVSSINPNCLIVTHGYDFPTQSMLGVGVCGIGPWLQPSLIYCGWTNLDDQAAIIKTILQRFEVRLAEWGTYHKNVLHIKTQGLLSPEDWGNEMHPNRCGFEKLAKLFYISLSPLLTMPTLRAYTSIRHNV